MSERPDVDLLSRFLLQRSGLRGVLVRLGPAWRQVQARGEYPQALATLLGQTLVAAPLFTGHVKVDGRLSIQLRGSGALRTLFAECNSEGQVRGIAQWQPPLPPRLDPASFGDTAMLAITIESRMQSGQDPQRYQGLVPLEGGSLAEAFEAYFARSEQLPTRIMLAADGSTAAGLMLQQLPGDGSDADADAWTRAQALLDTLTEDELLALPAETLLYRLFHEEGASLLDTSPLSFGCSCSRERVGSMLIALGEQEARETVADGPTEITCEFCGQRYLFDAIDIEQLFAGGGSTLPAPGLQ